jgi:hypothetical protein
MGTRRHSAASNSAVAGFLLCNFLEIVYDYHKKEVGIMAFWYHKGLVFKNIFASIHNSGGSGICFLQGPPVPPRPPPLLGRSSFYSNREVDSYIRGESDFIESLRKKLFKYCEEGGKDEI